MFSSRLSSFFQSPQKSELSVDESTIAELQATITSHHKALTLEKIILFGLRSEIAEARMNERQTANTLFAGSGLAKELQKKYLTLEEDIQKREQTKALLEINLKKLRNEEPDEALEERAGSYSPGRRMNFTAIEQSA
jgi:hypothetical protein